MKQIKPMKRTRLPAGRGLTLGLLVLAGLLLAGASGCTVWRMQQAAALAAQSEPFEQAGAAQAGPNLGRLLVVGDSTAVGTGASSPATSVAGLIGRDHPQLSVVNLARDGARFADIARQLQTALQEQQEQQGKQGQQELQGQSSGQAGFDVVLVLGGGNDVIRLTGQAALADGVTRTLAAARQLAPVVVLLPSGNVGNAPFFFPPWSWLMTQRSRQLHAIAREGAAQSGAFYVNVFAEAAADPFSQQPERFHAADGLHPSDAGYVLWYQALQAQADLSRRLDGLTVKASKQP